MAIFQIVAIGFVSTILILVLKKQNPEFGIYISMITGIIIFFMILSQLEVVINVLSDIADRINLNAGYIKIIFKIIGIAYISEFGAEICKDADQRAIAMKIEFAGKILILVVSLPIVMTLLDLVSKLLS
ncbi:stage III sporulation protein AD [Vallitalea okinawensis]|uniref:stage III sporulation protein AD n=1 Tax=Vallitalea okinawensis TaxID=2078660 RepID=UPI000CFD6890|nr:stage III sporulation protein AD [Vallitalea okinawensis]